MEAPLPVRRRLEMPFLLLCGMGLSAFFAGVGVLAYTGILVGSLFSHSFTFNGQVVSREEFWEQSLPLLLAYPVVLGFLGVIAYALWKEQLWAREAVMAFWGLVAVAQVVVISLAPEKVSGSEIVMGLAWLATSWAIAAWYFYGKANVRAYYVAIAREGSHG